MDRCDISNNRWGQSIKERRKLSVRTVPSRLPFNLTRNGFLRMWCENTAKRRVTNSQSNSRIVNPPRVTELGVPGFTVDRWRRLRRPISKYLDVTDTVFRRRRWGPADDECNSVGDERHSWKRSEVMNPATLLTSVALGPLYSWSSVPDWGLTAC